MQPPASNAVDVHKAKELIEAGAVRVVDVRTQFRFPAMPGAEYIALEDILARPREVLPKGKPILFICNVGQTSGVATQMALALGTTKVYNMEGGMEAWAKAGYATEAPPQPYPPR
ncbi:MAG: rhodanese-like domain-containing protein [Actinobacteria bacterium]|nr:rhodanese-like domain-containing protein [Actinomycetota bacterium]